MSYFTLVQNYINGKYTRPPNWADPCDKCGPFPYIPCGGPCGGPVGGGCECGGKEKCSCKKKSKCSCKKKGKKCSCKKKSKCIKVEYQNPCNPCNNCVLDIAPCYEPPICPPPPPPCDPCQQPWLKYWPWCIRSWGTCNY